MPGNYSIPPWIGQPADTAGHYAQGLQIGQRMGAEQAAEQYRQQQALRGQQQAEFDQQYKAQKLAMEVDEVTRKHKAISDYQGFVSSGMDPMQALQKVGPDIGVDPGHVALLQQQKQQHEAEQAEKKAALAETSRWHDLEAAKRSPAYTEGEDLAKAKDQLATLPEGSPRKQHIQTVIDSMEARHKEQEIEVSSTPGGGTTTRIVTGGTQGKSDLTSAERSRLSDDVNAAANSLRSLGQLKEKLSDKTVGAIPAIQSFLMDDVLAQFSPGFKSEARVKGREMIGVSAEEIVGELRRGGRFSEPEARRIAALLPSTGAASSAAAGKDKVDEISKVLAEKGAKSAISLKRPIPTEILSTLAKIPTAQLEHEYQEGWMDKETLLSVLNYRSPRKK